MATNPPPRDELEKFKAISINISSSFAFEGRFATGDKKKNKISRRGMRPITGRTISIGNGSSHNGVVIGNAKKS